MGQDTPQDIRRKKIDLLEDVFIGSVEERCVGFFLDGTGDMCPVHFLGRAKDITKTLQSTKCFEFFAIMLRAIEGLRIDARICGVSKEDLARLYIFSEEDSLDASRRFQKEFIDLYTPEMFPADCLRHIRDFGRILEEEWPVNGTEKEKICSALFRLVGEMIDVVEDLKFIINYKQDQGI